MILVDILLDGLFAAVAGVGFGAISDPPRYCLSSSRRSRLPFLPDDIFRLGYCHFFLIRFSDNRVW